MMEHRLAALPGDIETSYTTGKAGRWNRAAHLLTAAGALGAALTRRSRPGALLSGLALAAGSLATRFAVFDAGMASAADPAQVVGPQRQRLAERQAAHSDGSWLAGEGATTPVPRS
jgi:hypothetical protein